MSFPNRKNQRLINYDYSTENYYFVTICTEEHKCILSHIVGNGLDHSELVHTQFGKIVEKHLLNINVRYDSIKVDKYVIMPNHIHMIIKFGCDGEERSRPFPTLSNVIGLFKSGVSREIGKSIWQKSFHDHIIRGINDYLEIQKYIENNPMKWNLDRYYIPEYERKV